MGRWEMKDDLVKQLREIGEGDMYLAPTSTKTIIDIAADRIELLKGLVSYLAGTNKDHVRVMLAGNPIVCGEIISKARAALEKTDD